MTLKRRLPVLSAALTACLSALAFTPGATAQDDRYNDDPTAAVWYVNRTTTQLTSVINQGYRIVDLEVASVSPLRVDAALVRNTGSFAKTWWWLVNVDVTTLSNFIAANNARIIDLEPFELNGQVRFAAVMIRNSGADAKAWWWYVNTSMSTLSTLATRNGARITDLERYTVGARSYRAAVMIRNSGADASGWWWYLNATPATVSSFLSSRNARILDLENGSSSGRYDFIAVSNTGSNARAWWYYYNLTPSYANFLLAQHGTRAIDIERVGSRFNMVMLNSVNPLSRRISDIMVSRSDGARGVYLKRANGSVLASILQDRQHEPASTLKTLHHVHAMRRVYVDGNVSLATQLRVWAGNAANSCPTRNIGGISEPLETVLSKMMEASDNVRTRAVTDFFGFSALNSTADALGMSRTDLNHHIGCGTPANRTTLADIGRLHERVVNGYLGSQRQKFYDLMRNDFYTTGYAEAKLGPVLDQEASRVGLTSAQYSAFRSAMKIAHKKGGYTVSSRYFRCWGAWISLPFYQNGGLVGREYIVGSFVDGATNETRAIDSAATGAAEVLREEIRAAMTSWRNHVFGSLIPFGSGCLGTAGTPTHSVSGTPELGQILNYIVSSVPAGATVVMDLGISTSRWGQFRLPLDLGIIGAPGCPLLTEPLVTFSRIAGRAGTASVRLPIGTSTALIGGGWHTQFLVVDARANAAGLTVSNGMTTRLGGQR